ncbi:MAG: type II toxin-antitoxin system RelE/ParE family toxin [Bacteroidetes bacterium]|nr:type II toxin-antitoxin system RelE/ParE family toxin [Bacteroidota bacterium]
MKVVFEKKFVKDIDTILDKNLKQALEGIILNIEKASDITRIVGLKKLKGYRYSYRIRIGNYRIGLNIENNIFILVRFMHRKEIYRYFP